jgi:RNA polymerase sigma-70 factor (ECF subfamily)
MRMRDAATFDEFYAGTVRRVISQLYVMTGDYAEAEDAAQEAYARAWQRWDQVAGYQDPEAWVRTVAYRIRVSAWRKTVNRGRAYRRHGVSVPVAEISADYVTLVAALRRISENLRRVVVLHYLVGLSVSEIATETGASPSAVKARLSRGRQALSVQLGEPVAGHGPEEATFRA